MSLQEDALAILVPSRFITLTYPNPTGSTSTTTHGGHLRTPLLRVAVLDSPTPPATNPPRVAAMIVPNHRENDWNFSTQEGHLQLLLDSPDISRLILIGNIPSGTHTYTRPPPLDPVSQSKLHEVLTPLVLALSPKAAFRDGWPETPFLTYEDDVIRSAVVERRIGDCVGELLVENVELETAGGEFRRTLKFKRMPNLIQTQIRIFPNLSSSVVSDDVSLVDSEFVLDMKKLVHPYLAPMVAGLSLISSHLEQRIQQGFKPRALCLGVGGGALLTFLNTQLGFQVVGVENDEVVLDVARRFFGLQESENLKVFLGDGLKLIESLSRNTDSDHSGGDRGGFDVVMVDLDSSDAGTGTMAPPLEFTEKSTLLAARMALTDHGVLIVNVVPSSRSFYETLIQKLQEIFVELYEIDVGNEENFVLFATTASSPIRTSSDESANSFCAKLGAAISGAYLDSMRKI